MALGVEEEQPGWSARDLLKLSIVARNMRVKGTTCSGDWGNDIIYKYNVYIFFLFYARGGRLDRG